MTRWRKLVACAAIVIASTAALLGATAAPAGATLIGSMGMGNGTGQYVECHDWGYWYTSPTDALYHIICYRFSSAGVNLGEMLNVGVPHECRNAALYWDGSRPVLHLYHAARTTGHWEAPQAGENGARGCGTGFSNNGTQGFRVVSVQPALCSSNCYQNTERYTGSMYRTASVNFWTTCGALGDPCYYGHGYSAVFQFT